MHYCRLHSIVEYAHSLWISLITGYVFQQYCYKATNTNNMIVIADNFGITIN